MFSESFILLLSFFILGLEAGLIKFSMIKKKSYKSVLSFCKTTVLFCSILFFLFFDRQFIAVASDDPVSLNSTKNIVESSSVPQITVKGIEGLIGEETSRPVHEGLRETAQVISGSGLVIDSPICTSGIMTNTKQEPSVYVQTLTSFLGAFFAFCFFILGQLWSSSRKKRSNNIRDLDKMIEYINMQAYYFETNEAKYQDNIKDIRPISISLNELNYFPIEENVYQKMGRFKVWESTIKFIIGLRILNENIRVSNRWQEKHSEISQKAMLEKREDEFLPTMTEDVDKFKKHADKIYNSMISIKKQVNPLLAEALFTKKCIAASFLKRAYIRLRIYLNSNYRVEEIKNIHKKMVSEGSNNNKLRG